MFASADQQAAPTTPAPMTWVSAATTERPTRPSNPSHTQRDSSTANLTSASSDAAAPTTTQPDASTGIANAKSLPMLNEWGRFPDGGYWYTLHPSRNRPYPLRVINLPRRITATVGPATQAPTVNPGSEHQASWKDWIGSLWSTLWGASRAEAG